MIPPGASTCSALASKNPPLVPTVRTRRCSGQGGLLPSPLSPLPSLPPPLVNAQSLGPGRPTKFSLPRNGFLETLALIGHRLLVPEVRNKSGSSLLSSIIGTHGPSMSKGGTPDWCPTKSFPLATLQPPLPPPPTPPGSPAPGVANGTLPLPTPWTSPPTAGPLLPRLPSPLHPSASPTTFLDFLLCLNTIWTSLILTLLPSSPSNNAPHDAAQLRKPFLH